MSRIDPGTDPATGRAAPPVTCYRHGDRTTGIRCTRCERPICPECMRSAAVGFQCPDCVRQGQASVRRAKPTSRVRTLTVRFGPVTAGLVALNVFAYVITVLAAIPNGGGLTRNYTSALFQQLSLVPAYVEGGEYWRLLTSAFLHYGPLHLAINMIALIVLGADIERFLGWARFLALFLVAALAGGVAVTLLGDPLTQTVGASGGIFGLLGAAAIILLQRKADLRPLVTVLALNAAISFLPGISLIGHLGGAAGGALAGAILVYGRRRMVLQVGGLAVLTAALVIAVLLQPPAF